MKYQLEHVAIYCKDLNATIKFYEKFFGGQPTAVRKGDAGYAFCFMRIAGSPAIQLMESATGVGVHHYGFVTDNIDQVCREDWVAKHHRAKPEIIKWTKEYWIDRYSSFDTMPLYNNHID